MKSAEWDNPFEVILGASGDEPESGNAPERGVLLCALNCRSGNGRQRYRIAVLVREPPDRQNGNRGLAVSPLQPGLPTVF